MQGQKIDFAIAIINLLYTKHKLLGKYLFKGNNESTNRKEPYEHLKRQKKVFSFKSLFVVNFKVLLATKSRSNLNIDIYLSMFDNFQVFQAPITREICLFCRG